MPGGECHCRDHDRPERVCREDGDACDLLALLFVPLDKTLTRFGIVPCHVQAIEQQPYLGGLVRAANDGG